MRASIIAPWLVAWALLASSVAAAQDDAREHFRRGEAAYQKGNYELAVAEWGAAYGIDPRPRIQYNIYQAYERLGRLPEAEQALQLYLESADPDDPSYADATARMASLKQRLQATGIRIIGGVDGASVEISGHAWGMLPRPDRIPVQPGNHRVVIRMPGYQDFSANVVVPAGQVVDVPVELTPGQSTAAPPPPPQPAAEPVGTPAEQQSAAVDADDSGSSATPFYIAAGVLGAAAIGSVVWMANRSSELDGCDDPKNFCKEQDAVESQRGLAIGATVVFGVGAVGALIWGLAVGGSDEAEDAASGCGLSPLGGQCTVRF